LHRSWFPVAISLGDLCRRLAGEEGLFACISGTSSYVY
jgi:hypothetical protein